MPRKPRLIGEIEERIDERTAPDHPGDRKHGRVSTGHNRAALRAEQEAESAQTVTGAGPEHMTSGQWRGMVLGGLAGVVVGALVFMPFALIPFMEPALARVGLLALCGALAGAAASGVYWAGRLPELEGVSTPRGPTTQARSLRRPPVRPTPRGA